MADSEEIWRPGSFTKNFSWGKSTSGLSELHSIIRIGFADRLEDTPRELFRERISNTNRPDYIPMNFFLFNKVEGGESIICADELVFNALSWEHGDHFDRLALFAFVLSYAGKWKGAKRDQRRPAMWANAYVREHLAKELKWDQRKVNADDIESFVKNDSRYVADTTRKLATNLSYLFRIGRIGEFAQQRVSRWWSDCLFLALDRIIEDSRMDNNLFSETRYPQLLERSSFLELTGGSTMEKNLAIKHLLRLYVALGGRERLSDVEVASRTQLISPGVPVVPPNDYRPRGAVHPTNPRILKSIRPACSELARTAGFDVIAPDDMEEIQYEEFITQRTGNALAVLQERGIRPTMSLEELLKVTRER